MINYIQGLTFEEQLTVWINSDDSEEYKLAQFIKEHKESTLFMQAELDRGYDEGYEHGHSDGHDLGWTEAEQLYKE